MYYGNELLSVDVTDVTNHGWKKSRLQFGRHVIRCVLGTFAILIFVLKG